MAKNNGVSDLAARARLAVRELYDAQMKPLGDRALLALAPMAAEHILDIGCGAGQTTIQLAKAVGQGGHVTGIDLSGMMLGSAIQRTAAYPQLRLVQGDVGTYPFETASFDAAFSRFGVMFFADPTAAFGNIRRALKPGGRLAFVCWRAYAENEVDAVPLRAALPYLPADTSDPSAAPPFSLADAATVRRILTDAGFVGIEIVAHDAPAQPAEPDALLDLCLHVGSLGMVLREHPELRQTVIGPVRQALAARRGPQGINLNVATWIVTARSP